MCNGIMIGAMELNKVGSVTELVELEKIMVEKYQCPGCVNGSNTRCGSFSTDNYSLGCASHCAGTTLLGVGKILLGMPKGFNKVMGAKNNITILNEVLWDTFDLFNVPVWKWVNSEGVIFVRVVSPRLGSTRIIIFADKRSLGLIYCHELTQKELEGMD